MNLTSLSDYRSRVADLYSSVRRTPEPQQAWVDWRTGRDELFRTHSQSPLEEHQRNSNYSTPFFHYDPSFRVTASLDTADPNDQDITHSGAGRTPFTTAGTVSGELPTGGFTLTVYWLKGYGGGFFLPFSDTTNSQQTYGGGRYLLDGVKSADLGQVGGELVLDFNFSYHPSCVYSSQWSCPLAPLENRLDIAITAGEQVPSTR